MYEGEQELGTARMIKFYLKAYDLLKRTYLVINNLVQQFSAAYNKYSEVYRDFFHRFQMNYLFRALGKALSILYTMDEIIENNSAIKEDWN